MEAVVYNNNSLKFKKNYPMPKVLKGDDVLIKVAFAEICRIDTCISQEVYEALINNPFPIGRGFSGVVMEVGKNCNYKIGQNVVVDPNRACNLCEFCRKGSYQHCLTVGNTNKIGTWEVGGWAQYCVVPQDQVYVLPNDVTLKEGALCYPYACVAHGLDRASLSVGEKILIIGAGFMESLWITILHYHGHRDVTVVEEKKSLLDTVRQLDTAFRLVKPCALFKENIFFDVIIDCSGIELMEIYLKYMNPGGKYVVFGSFLPTENVSISPYEIYKKEITIIGANLSPYSFPKAISWLKVLGNRYLDYTKLGIKMYSLSQFELASEDLNKKGSITKAMFKL